MDFLITQMALTALTTKPVAYWHHSGQVITRDECHDDRVFEICCKVERPLYTTPPAQILRPVELPCGFSPAIGDIFDRQAPVMRRDKEDGEWLHKVTVAELLRSLGHEVKSC